MKTLRLRGYSLAAALVLSLAAQACSDDDNDNAKPPVVSPTAGSSGKSNDSGGSSSSGGEGSPEAGKAGKTSTGGTAGTPGGGGEGGDGTLQPACTLPPTGEDGCFNCPENGLVQQWLNRCVESDCEPFDNSRLPLLKADGSLPPLP